MEEITPCRRCTLHWADEHSEDIMGYTRYVFPSSWCVCRVHVCVWCVWGVWREWWQEEAEHCVEQSVSLTQLSICRMVLPRFGFS